MLPNNPPSQTDGQTSAAAENDSTRTNTICLTPVRNESWIIRTHVDAAKQWASHIIIADQRSTDGTRVYLQKCPSVDCILNDLDTYDEEHRQKLLVGRAREIPGKRILIGLDADEAFSANATETEDWQKILAAPPGTVLSFRWVNVLPGFERAWIPPNRIALGYVDDGVEHQGKKIHSARVPRREGAPILELNQIVVLHFQYIIWERMLSKQRWYQAWEHLKHRAKGPLDIYRQYNHMHGAWKESEIEPMKPEWMAGYDRTGVGYRQLKGEEITWWDREILQMIEEHGPEFFRKIAIWDKDWIRLAETLGINADNVKDPRSWFEKKAHHFLQKTQSHRETWTTRALERILRSAGW